jgi:predicted DCC family thiol-disulfide oxidoreductase YuxK
MPERNPIILFDGVCNFCNGVVTFIIKHDKTMVFRFAALQSAAGQALIEKFHLPSSFDTFILIQNGKAYTKSTAALHLYNQLSWLWKWTQLFWVIPRPIRDSAYNIIARNRYRWFGKREECMVPTPELRSRFIFLNQDL